MRFKGMSNEKEDPQNKLKQKEVDKKFYIRMSFELVNNPELLFIIFVIINTFGLIFSFF